MQKKAQIIGNITTDTEIEPNFVCSEKHRAFFKEHIGNGFSFNAAFQKWLKSNTGKTYADAITAYYRILEEKKNGKTKIDKQFEYNTYIGISLPIIGARALTRLLSAGNIKSSCRDIIVMKKAILMYWKRSNYIYGI